MRLDCAKFALLRSQADRFMALRGQHAQNLFAPVARQHVGKKSAIPYDDPKRAHELLRGRNKITYALPRMTINPPHHTGACRSASTVGGGLRHSARPLKKISAP